MALPGSPEQPQALTQLVRQASYYPTFQAAHAGDDLTNDKLLFERITQAIATYQREDKDYNAFSSRYDQHVAGLVTLTPSESNGMLIFNSPTMGNCASCHTSTSPDRKPIFTDFAFRALAVPRNPKTAGVAKDANFYDLGLCQSKRERPIQAAQERYCGQFKTPTLRNVERTAPYFHNASIGTLEEAIRFHFTRETDPIHWYGSAQQRYNDLPFSHIGNVVQGKPFDGSWQPSAIEMQNLIAFLKTLNDSDQMEVLPPKSNAATAIV